jgi:hypothetical protein
MTREPVERAFVACWIRSTAKPGFGREARIEMALPLQLCPSQRPYLPAFSSSDSTPSTKRQTSSLVPPNLAFRAWTACR